MQLQPFSMFLNKKKYMYILYYQSSVVDPDPGEIIPDPDPCSSGTEMNLK
jgi:hypothetical protein